MGKGEWENRMSENEEKKEYLKGYQDSIKKVKRLEEELIELRLNKFFPSLIQDGMPHGAGSSDLSSYASRVDELERKLIKARYENVQKFKKIKKAIENIQDKTEKRVIYLRYIKFFSWDRIMELTDIRPLYKILRIHGRALKNVKID